MATRTAATVDDVLQLAANGQRYELVDGETVEMSPTGMEHGGIEAWVSSLFTGFVLPRRLDMIFSGEPLFRLDPEGRLARAPDLAFVRRDRLAGRDLTGAFEGAPDLAVEIVSPSDSAKALHEKVAQWLSHGTLCVLVIYPSTQSVVLWREGGARQFTGEEEVDLAPALPGFRCKASDLFVPSLEDETGRSANVE